MSGTAYCTLFDLFYLSRGLVMIDSLIEHGSAHDRIYVFCFDERTFEIMNTLALPRVIPISLYEFETPELLKVKQGRTKGEYCWTSTAHTLLHVLIKKNEKECTYVDADLCFYQNPSIAISKSPEESVLITEHRYTPKYDQTKTSGRFCVQFVTFKNEPKAMALLKEWADQCIEWCYNRVEDGKFGDQKYLDAWPAKGSFVKISDHPGVGLAPWNIQQASLQDADPVFFHFHGLQWYKSGTLFLGGYPIPGWAKKQFYLPYIGAFLEKSREINLRFEVPLPQVDSPKARIRQWAKRVLFPHKFIKI